MWACLRAYSIPWRPGLGDMEKIQIYNSRVKRPVSSLEIWIKKWMDQILGLWHRFIYFYPEVLGPHTSNSFEVLSKVNVLGAKFNNSSYIQMNT